MIDFTKVKNRMILGFPILVIWLLSLFVAELIPTYISKLFFFISTALLFIMVTFLFIYDFIKKK